MAPRSPSRYSSPSAAPRARGDGPSRLGQRRWGWCYSPRPRPREWSRGPGRRRSSPSLLHAPAGMVPPVASLPLSETAAPRARGDGPTATLSAGTSTLCSPRPRGWSRRCVAGTAPRCLLPAPAGMVPARSRSARTRSPAPRPRGDDPVPPRRDADPAFCSPPARGWSHGGVGGDPRAGLLPARAGMMAPRTGCGSGSERPTPRACGDGPGLMLSGIQSSNCSSRPRGWPQRAPHGGVHARGPLRPAPAGMVPSRMSTRRTRRPAPFVRGIGPERETPPNIFDGCPIREGRPADVPIKDSQRSESLLRPVPSPGDYSYGG